MHAHARQHDDRACLVERFGAEHVKHRQNEHQQNARQLAEELRDAAVHFAHVNHVGQEVIQHALVETIAQTGNENG